MSATAPPVTPQLSRVRVLVVDDQPSISGLLEQFLNRSGMETLVAATGAAAVEQATHFRPEIALIDLGLPDIHGMALLPWLITHIGCGVIIVTENADEIDRVAAIEAGADDYVLKPINLREVVARIRAVHRRVFQRPTANAAPTARAVQPPSPAGVQFDRPRSCLQGGDAEVELTGVEATVLGLLLDAAGAPVSRESISTTAFQRPLRAEDRSVDHIILSLRRKLTQAGGSDRIIQSVRNQGYKIAAE